MAEETKKEQKEQEITDDQLDETAGGRSWQMVKEEAVQDLEPVKEQAIQDLEVVKDGIRDY